MNGSPRTRTTIFVLCDLPAGGRLNEAAEVGLLLFEVGEVQVHHVAGGVIVQRDVFRKGGIEAQMAEGVMRGQPGRGHVEIAARDVHFEKRISRKALRQRFRHVEITVLFAQFHSWTVPVKISYGRSLSYLSS